MVEHARRHVAVVDHTKLAKVANWRIRQPAHDRTDTNATEAMVAPFRNMGIDIIKA